jgi:hypothetical protein
LNFLTKKKKKKKKRERKKKKKKEEEEEALRSVQTFVIIYQSTQHNIPEDFNLQASSRSFRQESLCII